jgi:heme-degrading monooxygenase HmoA
LRTLDGDIWVSPEICLTDDEPQLRDVRWPSPVGMIGALGAMDEYGWRKEKRVHARVMNLRFPPGMRDEVVRVGRGLAAVSRGRRGFGGLQVLTDPVAGEGIIVLFWETEEAAEACEADPSYVGQMSLMSSFLYGTLSPKTYEVGVRA